MSVYVCVLVKRKSVEFERDTLLLFVRRTRPPPQTLKNNNQHNIKKEKRQLNTVDKSLIQKLSGIFCV